VLVEIEKQKREEGRAESANTSYAVVETDAWTEEGPAPTRERLVDRRASLADAIELGKRLTRQPVDQGSGYGHIGRLPMAPALYLDGDDRRIHGSTVSVHHQDPSPLQEGACA